MQQLRAKYPSSKYYLNAKSYLILKLILARKVSGHVHMCVGHIDFAFLRFSIRFWICSDSVVTDMFCLRNKAWMPGSILTGHLR